MKTPNTFPQDFVFGAATASYQIEGAASEDGRGPSVWDIHSRSSGKVKNGDTGDVACDHYHRFPEDVALMKDLGIQAYRFSLSWSRIMPHGEGEINQKGLDFYNRLIDALLAAGIVPWITLYHWDTPQALEEKYGGWRSRKTSEAFAQFAGVAARAFSDRVNHWFTMNEFHCFTDKSYKEGSFAPGLTLLPEEMFTVRHNALLGHGLAVKALRENCILPPVIGIADNPAITIPVMETHEHIEAARKAFREINCRFLTPVMEGRYLPEYLETFREKPSVDPADMDIISQKLDFVGMNMYAPTWAESDSQGGWRLLPFPKAYPGMHISWLKLGPDIAYWGTRFVQELWGQQVYITENGCSGGDDQWVDGEVKDTDRILFIRLYLGSALRALREGYPLKGYFHWSLMDNFEWNEGYSERFGLIHVDYETQKRTPKLSYRYYKEMITRRQLL